MTSTEINAVIEALPPTTIEAIEVDLVSKKRTVSGVALHYEIGLAIAQEIARRLDAGGRMKQTAGGSKAPAPVVLRSRRRSTARAPATWASRNRATKVAYG